MAKMEMAEVGELIGNPMERNCWQSGMQDIAFSLRIFLGLEMSFNNCAVECKSNTENMQREQKKK